MGGLGAEHPIRSILHITTIFSVISSFIMTRIFSFEFKLYRLWLYFSELSDFPNNVMLMSDACDFLRILILFFLSVRVYNDTRNNRQSITVN